MCSWNHEVLHYLLGRMRVHAICFSLWVFDVRGLMHEYERTSMTRRIGGPKLHAKVHKNLTSVMIDANSEVQLEMNMETLLRKRMVSTNGQDQFTEFPDEEEYRKRSLDAERMAIPQQLVMTGPGRALDLPEVVKSNIANILRVSPGMRLRYLSDRDCFNYLNSSMPSRFGLLNMFKLLWVGAFRGDVCRIAVLFREGGFYLDLDVDLHVPLHELVDGNTSFMAAYESTDVSKVGVLNAVMAVKPWSAVMRKAIDHMVKEFHSGRFARVLDEGSQFGPLTLGQGFGDVLAEECPDESIQSHKQELLSRKVPLQWVCGMHSFRFYVQRQLNCGGPQQASPLECTPARMDPSKPWLNFGIFKPGVNGELMAFSRASWCQEYGCNVGGKRLHHWSKSE